MERNGFDAGRGPNRKSITAAKIREDVFLHEHMTAGGARWHVHFS
jgi:hypothetical protein